MIWKWLQNLLCSCQEEKEINKDLLIELDLAMDKIEQLENLYGENPKEEELNSKYPEQNIFYRRQEIDGEYRIDVRNYLNEYDSIVPVVLGNNDDEIALNGLKWVMDKIQYMPDKTEYKIPEYWAYPYQTIKRTRGDCEDGAILLANILLKSGIPYWKIRLVAGDTPAGGHAYCLYFDELNDRWVSLDWCYYPNRKEIKKRVDYKDDKLYGDVWFSWNERYAFAKVKETNSLKNIHIKNG